MKHYGVTLVLVVVLCVAALPAGAQSGGTSGSIPGWTLTSYLSMDELSDLFQVSISPISVQLSPDGTRLAANIGSEGTCVAQLDALKIDCYPWPERLKPVDLYWSPGSDMMILHSDVVRYMMESDLWLLDLADGSYTNLTNDGADEVLGNDNALLDLVPTWNPATGDLYFFRSHRVESSEYTNGLYRIAAGENGRPTGQPELVADLTPISSAALPVYNSPGQYLLNGSAQITPDGTRLVALVRSYPLNPATTGIWLIDLPGGELSLLATWADVIGVGMPAWVLERPTAMPDGLAWLPDGSGVVIVDVDGVNFQQPNALGRLIAVPDGTVTPLLDFSGIADKSDYDTGQSPYGTPWRYDQMWGAALLPDGSALVYTSRALTSPDAPDPGFSAVTFPLSADAVPVRLATIPRDDYTPVRMTGSSVGVSGDTVRMLSAGYLLTFKRAGLTGGLHGSGG